MDYDDKDSKKQGTRLRGRMMDFSPRKPINSSRPVSHGPSDSELRRRELAKKEIARREEIHRQIEEQREKDIIAKRREIAARKDLARRLEIEREENAEALAAQKKRLELEKEREEKARRREMIEKRAMAERRRVLAERRARQAREELEARRRAELQARVEVRRGHKNPKGSEDPIVSSKKEKIEKRLGSVEDFENELNNLERESENFDEKDDDISAFVDDNREDYFDELEEKEIASNNSRYVLGGRSPFINTEVEKRPLSGGDKTLESTVSKYSKPQAKGRFVPYNEPLPHKNIYARTVAKEKDKKDVPTMVVADAPKSSKVSLIIAIILTIILGVTVGAIAYLALFQ